MPNNGDESLTTTLDFAGPGSPKVIAFGNFHKTLPHNDYGEVNPAAYATFRTVATTHGDYETVPRGEVGTNYVVPVPAVGDGFNNPQAGRSHDKLSGGAAAYDMPAAPTVRSRSTAAEFTELQWMAILRDLPVSTFDGNPLVATAVKDIRAQFQAALNASDPGGLRLVRDLPQGQPGTLDIRLQTLFRCGLRGEDKGPLISQFFLHDVAYGAQFIIQKVRPYKSGRDFLTDHDSWLRAQNAGLDEWAHGCSHDNDFGSDPTLEEPGGPRRLTTMRDICRFVNKDALHQAYFNAALACLGWGLPLDPGNPYVGPNRYLRQAPFGTFGGPDILTRVSEVAGRALDVVWRQKWEVHRRLRPEAYGGLMQMQRVGLNMTKRGYGLPDAVFETEASKRLFTQSAHKTYYLPMAFTAGSPPHPAYGAGHATVAGACVTVLKAWFDGAVPLNAWLTTHPVSSPVTNPLPGESPVVISQCDSSGVLRPYTGADLGAITVEGELNKIACNVAIGRSMGGVHWRSDNTRSLRLGEQIAAELLRSESEDYAERHHNDNSAPVWSFTSFDGRAVVISDGKVRVDGLVVDPKSGPI